jgi:hypothetical protein
MAPEPSIMEHYYDKPKSNPSVREKKEIEEMAIKYGMPIGDLESLILNVVTQIEKETVERCLKALPEKEIEEIHDWELLEERGTGKTKVYFCKKCGSNKIDDVIYYWDCSIMTEKPISDRPCWCTRNGLRNKGCIDAKKEARNQAIQQSKDAIQSLNKDTK